MPADSNALLDSHEERLQAMEQISRDTAGALSRIDESLQGLRGDVCDMRADLGGRIDRVEIAAREGTMQDLRRDVAVEKLELATAATKEHRRAVFKWVGGIAASVIATTLAVILAIALRLK